MLATCDRTEFLLWASDASLAANAVLRFRSSEYNLKLCERKHFYRLLDDTALLHIFRVAASLNSLVLNCSSSRIIARSIVFFSSRILPGQVCVSSSFRVSSASPRTDFLNLRL